MYIQICVFYVIPGHCYGNVCLFGMHFGSSVLLAVCVCVCMCVRGKGENEV